MLNIYFGIKMANSSSSSHPEMIQIRAEDETGSRFMAYIIPVGDIDQESTTGPRNFQKKGRLTKNGRRIPVKSVATAREGLKKFLKYLSSKSENKKAVLINCCYAEALKNSILRYLKAADVAKFSRIVQGFADTLPVFGHHLGDLHEVHGVKSGSVLPVGKFQLDALGDAQRLKKVVRRAAKAQNITSGQCVLNNLKQRSVPE